MSVSQVVGALSEVVARSRAPLSRWEQDLVVRLAEMPSWVQARDLAEWERRYQDRRWGWDDAIDSGGSPPAAELLDWVFDLGCYNLYVQYNVEATEREYRELLDKLNEVLGLRLRPTDDVSSW